MRRMYCTSNSFNGHLNVALQSSSAAASALRFHTCETDAMMLCD